MHFSPIPKTQRVADLDVLLALRIFMPLETIHGDLELSHLWCASHREDLPDAYVFLKRKPFYMVVKEQVQVLCFKCLKSWLCFASGYRNRWCNNILSFYQVLSNQFLSELLVLASEAGDHPQGALFLALGSLLQFGSCLGNLSDREMKRLLTEHLLCAKWTQ